MLFRSKFKILSDGDILVVERPETLGVHIMSGVKADGSRQPETPDGGESPPTSTNLNGIVV